ncbi:MAG: FecR domain-containing protein [Opitutaceae bacterium]|nr:FecR domain-containing protein [Opitutaceae bacterium]
MTPFDPSISRPRTASRSLSEMEDEAADWIVRRADGLSRREQADLEAWLTKDPRHAAAFAAVEVAWAAVNAPRVQGRGDALGRQIDAHAHARGRTRRRFALGVASLAAAAAVAFAVLRPLPDRTVSGGPTYVVRPNVQTLPDGSTVELNAGAEITVSYTDRTRSVQLVRGEGLFSVAKNPSVPFVVTAGPVEIRAVGTAFVVHRGSDQVDVLVTEGRVAVVRVDTNAQTAAPGTAPAPELFLDAGRRVVLAAAPAVSTPAAPPIQTVSTQAIAAATAWRDRRVEFTFTPLREAVALFNSQGGTQLILANEATAQLRITGVFWTDDAEGFVRLLESSLDLKSSRRPTGGIVLSN